MSSEPNINSGNFRRFPIYDSPAWLNSENGDSTTWRLNSKWRFNDMVKIIQSIQLSRRDNNQQRSNNFTSSTNIQEKTKAGNVDAVRELRRRFGRPTPIHQQTHPVVKFVSANPKHLMSTLNILQP